MSIAKPPSTVETISPAEYTLNIILKRDVYIVVEVLAMMRSKTFGRTVGELLRTHPEVQSMMSRLQKTLNVKNKK